MRAIFWKERRELRPATALLAVVAAMFGFAMKWESSFAAPVWGIHAGLGAALGAWQAFVDRRAAGDAFLLHRPIEAWRLHAARSAAGLLAVLAVSAAFFAVALYLPVGRGYEVFGRLVDPQENPLWRDFSAGVAAVAVLVAACGWATVRLGASMGGPVVSLFLACFLPTLLALCLCAMTTGAAAFALGVAALAAAAALLVARQAAGLAAGGAR